RLGAHQEAADIAARHAIRQPPRVHATSASDTLAEIGENDHRQAVIREPRILGPGDTGVRDPAMRSSLVDVPTKSVRVAGPVVEPGLCPQLNERRWLDDAAGGQRAVPGDQVLDAGEDAVVRGQLGLSDAADIDELVVEDRVAGGAVLENPP